MTLAIIDDDVDVRTALSRLLRVLGHDVHVFASAEDFEEAGAAVDCVVADVRLPGMSGFDLRERLRRGSGQTPIVLITGDGEWPDHEGLRESGGPLVTKPFVFTSLTAAIADAVAAKGVAANERDASPGHDVH